MRHILELENFEIIKKTIDSQDIVQTHRGDQIEAEIARVKCLQKFITYCGWYTTKFHSLFHSRIPLADARKLMDNDLIHPLLQVHQAFDEELGSSQWLKRWPDYRIKLKETLEKFMLNGLSIALCPWTSTNDCTVDQEHFETLDKDIQERLGKFGPTPNQRDKTHHKGSSVWLSKFLRSLLKMNEEGGISRNRVWAWWKLPNSLSLHCQHPLQRTRLALALVGLILSFNFFVCYLIIHLRVV